MILYDTIKNQKYVICMKFFLLHNDMKQKKKKRLQLGFPLSPPHSSTAKYKKWPHGGDLRVHRLCSGVSASSVHWKVLYTSCTSSPHYRGSSEGHACPALHSVRAEIAHTQDTVLEKSLDIKFMSWMPTDTSSPSFSAFLKDSFFCWKIPMVSWKAWK